MEIIIRLGKILWGILLGIGVVLLALSSIIRWMITGRGISDRYMDWLLDNMEKMEGNE